MIWTAWRSPPDRASIVKLILVRTQIAIRPCLFVDQNRDMDLSQLAPPEQRLWGAFPRGEWIDFRDGNPSGDAQCLGKQREIRAEVIRALLLGPAPASPDIRRQYGCGAPGW